MNSLFFILLATTLGASYSSLNTSEEAPRCIALTIATFSFILNMVMAPWFIQLLVLMLVWFGTRKMSLSINVGLDK